MSAANPSPTPLANEGFTTGGDLILRSSDDVDFSVHSSILSIVSPVFSDMLTVGTGTSSDVVTVGDSAEALSLMLNFIYHRGPLSITTFKLLDIAFHIADKYELKGMKPQLRKELSLIGSPISVSSDPLGALAFATSHGLAREATLAVSAASKSYDFRKVDDLLKLADKIPSISPIVKAIGVPSARTTILVNVLFQFHLPPMALAGDHCYSMLCGSCDKIYVNRRRYGAPEWQARWAYWVFQELKDRPIDQSADIFTVDFFKLAIFKGSFPMPSGSCNCHTCLFNHKAYFEEWSGGVHKHLLRVLGPVGKLESIA
jgi:hypothetical protein